MLSQNWDSNRSSLSPQQPKVLSPLALVLQVGLLPDLDLDSANRLHQQLAPV